MSFFSEAAIKIGEDTETAATEVIKAFTLIGSAQPELLKSREELAEVTRQSLILAKAAGIDTVAAAEALTGAMNQFGASAGDAAKFTDIFATSQQKGASRIQDTALALENSGSAADAAGLSFETTNAAIQALAKGSLTGARAGTALRGVLGKLSKQNDDEINPSLIGLGRTIEELASRNLTLKEAIELVGEEGAVGLLTLIKQRDIFNELDGTLNDVGNALEQMAINTDNLDGSIERSNQSWERFVVSLNDGNGIIGATIRGIVDLSTETFDLFTLLSGGLPTYREFIDELAAGAEASARHREEIRGTNEEIKENIKALLAKELAEKLARKAEAEAAEIEKNRARTIGELRKQINDLRKAQLDLIPASKELAINQAEILRIERLLGKEDKKRTKELAVAKKKQAELEKKALKFKQLLADAEVANIVDKEIRIAAIENLRFERLKIQLIKEFGLTADTKLLLEELEKTHQLNLAKISDDAAKKIIADDIKEIERKQTLNEEEERKSQEEADQKSANQLLARETALGIAQEVSDALFANANRNREREFAESLRSVNEKSDAAQLALDNQLANGLISQESFNTKSKQLDDKRATQETALRKTAFDEQKRVDLLQAAINGALAIVKAIALFGPPPSPTGIAAIAEAVALTGIELAFIKGRKFARGGISHQQVVNGPSHSGGGVDYVGSNGHGFNVEGGELITIVNKKSTGTIRGLSNLNQMNGNGVAFGRGGIGNLKFQDGGFANREAASPNNETDRLAKILGEEISKITIVADIEDITDANDRKIRIEDRSLV